MVSTHDASSTAAVHIATMQCLPPPQLVSQQTVVS